MDVKTFLPLLLCPMMLLAADAPAARIDGAKLFPFFAAGGGWESTISLINVGDSTVDYRLTFYGTNGQRARVTIRDRNAQVSTSDTLQGRLNDDGADTMLILDSGVQQTGWVLLEYDGDNRIAGNLIFRQRVSGRPDYEASTSLTRNNENRFWIAFDNTQNFATTMAITNPSTSDSTTLQLRFWDVNGNEILTREIRMGGGTTVAFSLPQQYPELAGRSGQMRVEGSGGSLSGIALRFNPGGSFTSVPVSSR